MRADFDQRGPLTKRQALLRLPLHSYTFHEGRAAAGGTTALTVQLIERPAAKPASATHRLPDGRPGELVVGVVSDMKDAFALSRTTYSPRTSELPLDFGLTTMFATSRGDLLGRGWRRELERHDRRIAGLAARLQSQGLKPTRSKRYRVRLAAFRGFLREAIGRVFNRLVQTHAPAHLVLERLDFRAPGLSRRLNRLLARCGRAVVRAKLQDLEERWGITHSEVNPAYSSQTCSSCGYVAKANRKSQALFVCGSCGHTIHADVNAARNLEGGRSAFDRAARLTKADSLQATVFRHVERLTTRGRVASAERLRGDGYYADFLLACSDLSPTRLKPPLPVASVLEG
jgi:putative transposase